MKSRIDALRAATRIGEALLELLGREQIDDATIRSLLMQRRELVASCDPHGFDDEEQAAARTIVELDRCIVALCEERSRAVASTLSRVRQRPPTTAPGRVLTDLA